MENVSLMMAGAQLGITICSLGLGYLGEPAIAHFLEGPFEAIGVPESLVHPIAFAIALGIIGYLHVVFGEMVPKNIALAGPDRAVAAARAADGADRARPAPRDRAAELDREPHAAGLRRRAAQDEVTSAFTRDEVAGLVSESTPRGQARRERAAAADRRARVRGARRALGPALARRRGGGARRTSRPRRSRTWPAARATRASRCSEGEELIGYLHLKDALEIEDRHRNRPIARSWIRSLAVVNAADPLRIVLATMQRANAHLARVDDTDGTVLGVAALEDVLEELVGEIRDDTQRVLAR